MNDEESRTTEAAPPDEPDIGGASKPTMGIETFPPEATVKPGPLPPKEIRKLFSEEMIERLCLTWTMWRKAEDKARVLADELAAAKQEASNQRAVAEAATSDAIIARRLLANGDAAIEDLTAEIRRLGGSIPSARAYEFAPASPASGDRSAGEEA